MKEPRVLFEDRQMLVLNKPSGMLSQPDGTKRPSILAWARGYLLEKRDRPGEPWLGLVHRLDRQVSGVMALARTSKAAGRLSRQFRERSAQKIYLSLCSGAAPGHSGTLDYIMAREAGKTRAARDGEAGRRAELRWTLIGEEKTEGAGLSLLKIELLTGIRHQIRAQLSELRLPVLGDALYGGLPGPESYCSIGLCALRLTIEHPVSRERMTFEARPESVWPWTLLANDSKLDF
jgi:23S rRNA pseudouridine1911/1915/1917 synthase